MRNLIALLIFLLSGFPAASEPAASHLDAATELLGEMDMERQMIGGASAMADAMVFQNPMMIPYRDVVIAWASKYMTWDNLQGEFARLYADAYSEDELRQLTAFYKTPVGRKTVELGPALMKQGAEIGARLAAKHSADMEEMIRSRAAELQESVSPAQ